MAGTGRVLGERGRARWFVTRALLVAALSASSALGADSDGDGLDDAWEQLYFGGLSAVVAADPDGDGLTNAEEHALGSDPTRFDTDGDGLSDGRERDLRTDPTLRDSDGDGLSDYAETQVHHTNPRRRDTDGGGRGDGEEVVLDGTNPLLASDDALDSDGDGLTNQQELSLGTDPFATDTDGDLLGDTVEDANHDGIYQGDLNENGHFEPELGEETDPTRADTDGDGLNDGLELLRGTDPFDTDSDDDGLLDGDEYARSLGDDACLNPANPDSDGDGVNDGVELAAHLDPCNPDSDGDGVLDGVEVHDGTDPAVAGAGLDTDGDGLTDSYEIDVSGTDPGLADSDGDGLSDAEEVFPLRDGLRTAPLDADSDDDGLFDGSESVIVGQQLTFRSHPLRADSDGDGLLDGLERGLAVPELSALDPDATDLAIFQADTDPSTTTDPLEPDSDGDGLSDGAEDRNHDGFKQADETDPNVFDTDGDGIGDGAELEQNENSACGQQFDPTNPNDGSADFDGDGLSNSAELALRVRINLVLVARPTDPCKPDTDGDGLSDRVEARSAFVNGQTDPTSTDTDGDGISDGVEDTDQNGRRSASETDPTSPDTDGDGLRDGVEDANRNGTLDSGETDPRLADSDGDGLDDGTEVFRLGTDPLNTDTDGDGISDGRERGVDGDADPASLTDPLAKDSDGDGLDDGVEDANQNGRVDLGETNPTDRDTDDGGVSDGREVLMDGTDPNDPKDDKVATGSTPEIPDDLRPDANPVELPPDDPEPDPRFFLEPNAEIRGSSCSVGVAGGQGSGALPLGLAAAAVAIGAARRRRRARAASWFGLLGSLFAGALAGKAWAQTPDQIATARNTNIDANPHRINPAGFELLGVSRPRVLPHLALRAAASFNYLTGPAVVADRTSGDTLRKLVANREEAELGFALGIADRFQVSLMAPAVLHQRAELPGQNLGTATSSGFGNPTIVPRAVIAGAGDGPFALGVEVPVTLPLYDTPAYMGYDGWGVEPRLLTEAQAGPVVISTAIGALFKPEQRIFNIRDGNQLTYGLSTLVPDALKGWDFGAEFQGGTPLDRPGRSAETRGEVLIGARHRIDERLSVSTGGGAGVMSGVGQSGYRVFVSVGYAASLVGTPDAESEDSRKSDCAVHPGLALPPGCPPPDSDHDGILDALDKCPNEAEDKDGFEDDDGCPDLDNDQDGLKDSEDGCPNEAEDRDGFKDADGCPEPDNDGDGILDAADKCPFDAEDEPGEDADGCPKQMARLCPDGARPTATGECLAHIDAGLIQISEPVQFEEGTANLKDASRELLNQVVDILDANPGMKVQVVGHTDSWGPRANNLELSRERARAVRYYLIRQSKDPTRMARNVRSLGKGESQPIESNDTAVGRAKNRRVEFVIVGK
ncbi:MAG TPA: OmpA family protein [Polyangiaceae bacterium]|nr:OmpA family protein [Polyangiaceae bacterium]